MNEINHFSHKTHSLKLIENWETFVHVGDDNHEKKKVICYGCQEPISGGSTYGCILCCHFLHEVCAKLTPTFNHHLHPLHPLTLIEQHKSIWICDVCGSQGRSGFSYHCFQCKFDACTKCVVALVTQEATKLALKEEASVKLEHEGHPQHTLTLQLRPAAFNCDACNVKEEDLFYQCDSCDFWIHKTCAFLASKINLPHHPNHPLVLVYSLPDNFYNFLYFCDFCNKLILRNIWLYHCPNCRYFVHIKCALNAEQPSVPSDAIGAPLVEECENNFMHFPMADAFIDPLKQLHFGNMARDEDDVTEINHWSHNHPLFLNVESQGNNMPNFNCSDSIEVCYGCVRPLTLPYYSCKKGCSFTLHKYCAKLPLTLEHQLHTNHSLYLVNTYEDETYYKCNGCGSYGNTFAYKCETCVFYLDVNCAFLSNTIKHESHEHPLIQVIDPNRLCKACDRWYTTISYVCNACNYQLDMFCALQSPHFVGHRYCKGHETPLMYPPVENHPEDFYCDICEKEMHPKYPLYHCLACKNSFHLQCIRRFDRYANVKKEGTEIVSYHKHQLTLVRRKKTSQYVCYGCNLDINGHLIFECRTGTCPFRICISCHNNKIK